MNVPLTTMARLGQLSTFLAHGACVVKSGFFFLLVFVTKVDILVRHGLESQRLSTLLAHLPLLLNKRSWYFCGYRGRHSFISPLQL